MAGCPPVGTARFLWRTALRELGKAVARWLAGAFIVGAVFFGPNGVDPHDIVHHLRGSVLVALVVAALATAWIAPSVRRAMIAPGTDVLRALPYHRGVLGGALFAGVLAAVMPLAVLVVAGGGPGVAFAIAIGSAVAAVQPRAPSAAAVRTWAARGARLAFAGGSIALSFRAPIATTLVAGPFGAWALAGAFREARADHGSPVRLVFGAPTSVSLPWAVLVEGARSDIGATLRAGVLFVSAAWLARQSLDHFASPALPAAVCALAASALAAPGLVLSWARAARSLRALPIPLCRNEGLARRAAILAAVVPFWAMFPMTGSLAAGFVAASTFAGFAVLLATDPLLGDGGRADERLPAFSALAVAASAPAFYLAPWGPAIALFAIALVRRVAWRRTS